MQDNLAISGRECVIALTTVGFSVVRRTEGSTVLRRGDQLAIVPDTLVIANAVLDRILDVADLTIERLVFLISEAPTMRDLGSPLPAQ